jgi:hypothetical protein
LNLSTPVKHHALPEATGNSARANVGVPMNLEDEPPDPGGRPQYFRFSAEFEWSVRTSRPRWRYWIVGFVRLIGVCAFLLLCQKADTLQVQIDISSKLSYRTREQHAEIPLSRQHKAETTPRKPQLKKKVTGLRKPTGNITLHQQNRNCREAS